MEDFMEDSIRFHRRYMELANAQHFETGITMRHKLSVVEFP